MCERGGADGRRGGSARGPHDVVVARVLDAAAGLGDLLTRADAQAVVDGAVEILRGRYLAALLNAIEHGNVDPGLLDRFERLCGFDTPT